MKKNKPRSPTSADVEMGKRIRIRRLEMGISQMDLGLKIGVAFQQIQKYERGVNRVGAGRLAKIADALETPVTFFYPQADTKTREVESLLFIDSHFSLRLLRAYVGIKDQVTQRAIVTLMESLAVPS